MKQAKDYLKIRILLVSISFIFNSCEKEHYEEIPITSENLENDLFQSVSIQESMNFFSKRKLNKLQARALDPLELKPDLSRITQEEILNTNIKLTVIPAETKYADIKTRILQIKSMDGKIHSLLFNEIPDTKNSTSDYFNGVISLTTIKGEFIEGFRVVDGNAVSQFVKQSTYSSDCDESLNPDSIFCNQQLEEVFIGSQSIRSINTYTSQSYGQGPIYPSYVWRYNNNGYYGYAQGYMNYLRSLPCESAGQVKNEYGVCIDDNTWTENTILFANVSDPILTDIKKYLNCFDLSSDATITIYVDQPKENSSDTWRFTYNPLDPVDVGHTFISITQNEITRTLGYYPTAGTINPGNGNISSTAVIRNNEGHEYDVSISASISGVQLSNVINSMASFNTTYNLNTYNCTDFGISIANSVGLNLPDTSGTWKYNGNGSNPGNLGQDIRAMTPTSGTINTTGGNAPSNKGNCN